MKLEFKKHAHTADITHVLLNGRQFGHITFHQGEYCSVLLNDKCGAITTIDKHYEGAVIFFYESAKSEEKKGGGIRERLQSNNT